MADLEQGLKPCPFCETKENGDGKIRMHLAESSEGYFTVVCWCGVSGPIIESKRTSIESWFSFFPYYLPLVPSPFYSSEFSTPFGFIFYLNSVALPTFLLIFSSDNFSGFLPF